MSMYINMIYGYTYENILAIPMKIYQNIPFSINVRQKQEEKYPFCSPIYMTPSAYKGRFPHFDSLSLGSSR